MCRQESPATDRLGLLGSRVNLHRQLSVGLKLRVKFCQTDYLVCLEMAGKEVSGSFYPELALGVLRTTGSRDFLPTATHIRRIKCLIPQANRSTKRLLRFG